jgi:nicotinamide phosphoribosyltransferase
MNPFFLADFYKISHRDQYPSDTEQVWSNWTPRSSRVAGTTDVVHFGLQYFLKHYLGEVFQSEFFGSPLAEVISEYRELITATLGVADPKTDHIEALHKLGHLPLKIYSLPEGSSVPLGVPAMVVTNTIDEFFWLPNFLETILSNTLWKPSTSATTAQRFRRVFEKRAKEYGHTDLSFIDWQGHDFSFRGMSGVEDAILSGMGHLTSFSGTDTIPAIVAANKYYRAGLGCGGSVPATEHSVMCAGGQDGEFETFERLITKTYPSGVVSVVSDTWDLWTVLTNYVPRLKNQILGREGKVVIRPDSGNPEKILCGDPFSSVPRVSDGVLRLLRKALGSANGMINGAGAIYGDSITVDVADKILDRTINEIGLSPFNVVFGIGSFAYEYVTRDTHNFAMKATAVRRSGKVIPIFKNPVTDTSHKKSHKGIPAVYRTEASTETKPVYYVSEGSDPSALDNCAFEVVYENGKLFVDNDFQTIRNRVRA